MHTNGVQKRRSTEAVAAGGSGGGDGGQMLIGRTPERFNGVC